MSFQVNDPDVHDFEEVEEVEAETAEDAARVWFYRLPDDVQGMIEIGEAKAAIKVRRDDSEEWRRFDITGQTTIQINVAEVHE